MVYRVPRVLRWLTRLLRPQQSDAQGATSGAALAPPAAVITLPAADPGLPPSNADAIAVAVGPTVVEPRETCPDCGRTGMFAGPPGHLYCMHCALRQELFDSKTGSI